MSETAFITGASAGFGADFARQMAPMVQTLILVARRADRLETLKAELLAQYPELKVHCFPADLQLTTEIDRLLAWLAAEKLAVDWLINNAGLGDVGNLSTAEWPRINAMLQVNMIALTRLTHALVPAMVERRRGHILNIGSIAGYLALPGFAVYAASKAFVNSFSEGLYWELQGTGVTVTAVCPGPVQTEFLQVAARPNGRKAFDSPKFVEIPSSQVVRQSLEAALQGRPRLVPGFFVWLGAGLIEVLPSWWMRILYRLKLVSAP